MWVSRKEWEFLTSRVNKLDEQVEMMGNILGIPGYDGLGTYWKKGEPNHVIVAARLLKRAATILENVNSEGMNQ